MYNIYIYTSTYVELYGVYMYVNGFGLQLFVTKQYHVQQVVGGTTESWATKGTGSWVIPCFGVPRTPGKD